MARPADDLGGAGDLTLLQRPKKWKSSPMVAVLRPTRAAAESLIVLSMSEATPPYNAPSPFKWTFSTSMWQAALPGSISSTWLLL